MTEGFSHGRSWQNTEDGPTYVERQPAEDYHGKQVEVVHFPDTHVDVLINHDAEDAPSWGPELAEEFRYGSPRNIIGDALSPSGNVSLISVSGQLFAAKRREWTKDSEGLRRAREQPEDIGFKGGMPQLLAHSSLVNEMHLSPLVKEAMASPTLQARAAEQGFERIEFIEPIIGAVRHRLIGDQKWTVHRYIPDAEALRVAEAFGKVSAEQRKTIVDAITAELRNTGIEPYDFDERQILMDPARRLYLVDAEGYRQVRPEQGSQV